MGEREEALGQIWHVPNDRPTVTQREFAEILFAAIGKPPKVSAMGKLMMRLGGLFIPEAREMVEMMYEFDQPFVVQSDKFEAAFGMKATPLADSIAATVRWFQANPHAK
ncbi:MAG: hypothetical protein HC802_05665 [Caldilineaceae bacterium]|nr:hypothetical protein [Caldilineaceae bacterium]